MRILLVPALLFAFWAPTPAAASENDTAICAVCVVREGHVVAPEPVRATRVYKGVTYGFCSRECAEEFEKDPARYVAALAIPEVAPADTTLRAPLWELPSKKKGVSSAPS